MTGEGVVWYEHRSAAARRVYDYPVGERPRPDVEVPPDMTGWVCRRCGAVIILPDPLDPGPICLPGDNGCGRPSVWDRVRDLPAPEDASREWLGDGRPVIVVHRGIRGDPLDDPGAEVLATCSICDQVVGPADDPAGTPDELPPADLVVPCRVYADDRTVDAMLDQLRRERPDTIPTTRGRDHEPTTAGR